MCMYDSSIGLFFFFFNAFVFVLYLAGFQPVFSWGWDWMSQARENFQLGWHWVPFLSSLGLTGVRKFRRLFCITHVALRCSGCPCTVTRQTARSNTGHHHTPLSSPKPPPPCPAIQEAEDKDKRDRRRKDKDEEKEEKGQRPECQWPQGWGDTGGQTQELDKIGQGNEEGSDR